MEKPNVVLKTLSLKKTYQGPKCSVMNCDNSTRKRDELNLSISFHRYPRDASLRKEWIKRCRPANCNNFMNRHVCSDHFEPRSFCKKHKPGSKCKLVGSALPTLNLPPPLEATAETVKGRQNNDPLAMPSAADATPQTAEVTEWDDLNKIPFDQDIEMVELSSEEEDMNIVDAEENVGLTAAAALKATTALHVLKSKTPGPPMRLAGSSRPRRKSNVNDKSPNKSVDVSRDGSIDSSKLSDEDGDDEEITYIPSEEVEFIDLQDPLELAYTSCKSMNVKARRATNKAYLCRIASFFPPRFPRSNLLNITESALQYLDEVTKENAIMAIEQEILSQRHYALRKKIDKLNRYMKKHYSKSQMMETLPDD